jgi:hypothetical protein
LDEDAVILELALVVAETEPEPVTEAVEVCNEPGTGTGRVEG